MSKEKHLNNALYVYPTSIQGLLLSQTAALMVAFLPECFSFFKLICIQSWIWKGGCANVLAPGGILQRVAAKRWMSKNKEKQSLIFLKFFLKNRKIVSNQQSKTKIDFLQQAAKYQCSSFSKIQIRHCLLFLHLKCYNGTCLFQNYSLSHTMTYLISSWAGMGSF